MWVPLLLALAIAPETIAQQTIAPTVEVTTVYESGEFLRVIIPMGVMIFIIGGLVGYREYKRRKKPDEPRSPLDLKRRILGRRPGQNQFKYSFYI